MATIEKALFQQSLWSGNLCKLFLANTLFVMSVYMLFPALFIWTREMLNVEGPIASLAIGIFGVGLFLFGGFCSYLIQRYRRNKVCIFSMSLLAILTGTMLYVDKKLVGDLSCGQLLSTFFLLRLFSGAFYGLACIIINGTLFVDSCKSAQRTSVNLYSGWCHVFSIPAGLLVGLLFCSKCGVINALCISAIMCLFSVGLLAKVKFPFKAPEETITFFSLDRFYIPQSVKLVVPVVLLSLGWGLFLFSNITLDCLSIALVGIICTFVLNGKMKLFSVSNAFIPVEYMIMILSPVLILYGIYSFTLLSMLLCGLSFSLLMIKYNLFFINVSDHCKRGTSQNTYILSMELGLTLGLALAFLFSGYKEYIINMIACCCFVLSYIIYMLFTKRWLLLNLRK